MLRKKYKIVYLSPEFLYKVNRGGEAEVFLVREFPGAMTRHLHGSAAGYGKALRDRLAKDIVMCEWHYGNEHGNFPSMAVMQKEGFRVIGATWKREATMRNFSRYALSRHAMA